VFQLGMTMHLVGEWQLLTNANAKANKSKNNPTEIPGKYGQLYHLRGSNATASGPSYPGKSVPINHCITQPGWTRTMTVPFCEQNVLEQWMYLLLQTRQSTKHPRNSISSASVFYKASKKARHQQSSAWKLQSGIATIIA